MYLCEHLYNLSGTSHAGVGLLPGDCRMQTTLAGLGLQSVDLPEGNLRGHSFHYSKCEASLPPIALAYNPNNGQTAESVYRLGRLTASYIHFYFPSNARALAALFLP